MTAPHDPRPLVRDLRQLGAPEAALLEIERWVEHTAWKECPSCWQPKPAEAFGLKRLRDGRRVERRESYCKACRAAWMREKRAQAREEMTR